MDPIRVYPLRLNKRKWKIPIHTVHRCDRICSKTFIKSEDDPRYYILVDNPDYIDGKCSKNGKMTAGSVKLFNFDINNPMAISGPLHNPEEVVLPDRKITIDITFPITNPIHSTIDFGHGNITRKELLHVIQTFYEHIYTEEEKTSPPSSYTVVSECFDCPDTSTCINDTDCVNDRCSICLDNYEEKQAGKLSCNHVFHVECITQWLNQPNRTCPCCRCSVNNCDNCDNKGWLEKEYEAVVIPLEHRGIIMNRNTTYGTFGIYDYDLEDLAIRGMQYDRVNKHLSIEITA